VNVVGCESVFLLNFLAQRIDQRNAGSSGTKSSASQGGAVVAFGAGGAGNRASGLLRNDSQLRLSTGQGDFEVEHRLKNRQVGGNLG